ncbi:MAG: hypothetical protein WC755_08770 [Candidatus Woesearchaeota archaeon]
MATISIVLIVLIVVVSLNFNPQADDSTGQAYMQNMVEDDIIRVENSPAMTKIYVESDPDAYAYLRNKPKG